jgi:hypothetical protein
MTSLCLNFPEVQQMTSNTQSDQGNSGTLRSHLGHSLHLAHSSSDALIEAHLQLYRQIETVNRKWFDRLGETRDSEVALGNMLLQCPNPVEAGALCREWIMRQGTILAADMQDSSQLWLDFCSRIAAVGGTRQSPESEKAGSA